MLKTNIEKIDSIKLKIQQLENERKKILQAQKETDRKARTKRLIERGAILESLVSGADTFTNDQIKSFLEKTVTTENARKTLDGLIPKGSAVVAEKTRTTEQGGG